MRHALLSTEFGHFDMLVDCFNTCCCEIIIIYYHLLNCVRKTEGKESNVPTGGLLWNYAVTDLFW